MSSMKSAMRLSWGAIVLLAPGCVNFATAVAHMRRKAPVREKKAYDTSVRGFSPDGSIYQVEYAVQAAEKGGLTIGVQTDEGLVLAAQGRRRSPLLKSSSVSKIADIDTSMSCAMSGLLPDGRLLVDYARTWIQEHRFEFDEAPSVEAVASQLSRLALKFNGYDKDGKPGNSGREEDDGSGGLAMARPVGVALLMAGVDRGGRPVLYHLDPSGAYAQWRAKAIGEKGAAAETKLETAGPYGKMTIKRAMTVVLRVLKDILGDDFSTDRLEMVCVDLCDSRDGDGPRDLVAPDPGGGGEGDLGGRIGITQRDVPALPKAEGVEDANGRVSASVAERATGVEVCIDERASSGTTVRDNRMFRRVSKSEMEALLLSVEEARG